MVTSKTSKVKHREWHRTTGTISCRNASHSGIGLLQPCARLKFVSTIFQTFECNKFNVHHFRPHVRPNCNQFDYMHDHEWVYAWKMGVRMLEDLYSYRGLPCVLCLQIKFELYAMPR